VRRAFLASSVFASLACRPKRFPFSAAQRTHTAQAQKPTIVLVHGGWAESSGWNQEITKLQQLGYTTIAPAKPASRARVGRRLHPQRPPDDQTPIVLAGHSYGGAVISNAAVGVPNVKALVYIAGFAPDKGESLVKLVTMNPGSQIGPKTLLQRKYPLAEGTEGTDLYLAKHGFDTAFASDVPKKLADQMWAEQRPFSQAAFESLSGEPAWKTIPSWYLVATQDHAIPPATQMFMAHRAHAKIFTVKASHVPMVSQPAATTAVIPRPPTRSAKSAAGGSQCPCSRWPRTLSQART
jgi:pimeloyl-ACP methyl ester carboxylesterase